MGCKLLSKKGFLWTATVILSLIVGGLSTLLYGVSASWTDSSVQAGMRKQVEEVQNHLAPINYTVVLDSATVSKANGGRIIITVDSLFGVVKENQQWIIRRQETLVNDIRQETNNSIDKLAIWSGIGICLISLFGCILPMFQSKINRDDLEKEINRITDESKEQIMLSFATHETKIKDSVNEARKLMDELRHQATLHELQDRAQCMIAGLESKQVDNNEFLRVINDEVWRNMCQNFAKIVGLIKEDLDKNESKVLPDDRFILLTSLLRIEETLRSMSSRMTNHVLIQEVQLLQDSLRKLTIELCSPTFIFNDNFITSLQEFVRSLSLFRP